MEEEVQVIPAQERGIGAKLLEIQRELKVEKGRYNSFGDFWSRSREDILEAVKPLAHERGCYVTCNETVMPLDNGWVYIESTYSLVDAQTGERICARAYAREPESKPKMDSSQTTGSASSYAGKRALGNLFAIDDTADADQIEQGKQAPKEGPFDAKCSACGAVWSLTKEQFESFTCPQCGNKHAKVL